MGVSVKDVAEGAGVSVGTVSNVLNRPGKVSAATVERVQRVIDELGFVRNDAARQLRAGRSRSIGLIVLDLRNPFFAEVARGAEDRAAQEGLSVLVADSADDGGRERAHLSLFEEQRSFGVLLTPVGDDLETVRRMRERGIPVVLVDHDGSAEGVPSVAVDDVEGGRIAAEHLVERGRRRLAFVGGPASLRQVRNRLAGARSATEAAGAPLEHVVTDALTVHGGRAAGAALLARPSRERPDGIVAANDLVALGLLQALVMTGSARVPDDVALVGYDDIDFAASAVVPLTSVRQPARAIGATAVELLLDASRGGDVGHASFRPELVVRATS